MKKLIILLVLLFLVGCSVNSNKDSGVDLNQRKNERLQDQSVSPAVISENDLKLGNIKTNMTESEVLKAVGTKPSKISNAKAGLFYFYDDGTEIMFAEGRVYSVKVTDSAYPTPRGLRVGDDQLKVKELYGEPVSVKDGLWTYSFESGEYNTFFVKVSNGRVEYIKVSLVM